MMALTPEQKLKIVQNMQQNAGITPNASINTETGKITTSPYVPPGPPTVAQSSSAAAAAAVASQPAIGTLNQTAIGTQGVTSVSAPAKQTAAATTQKAAEQAAGIQPQPTTATAPKLTAEQLRAQELEQFSGWSNDALIREYQLESWNIYVATGKWDSPRQQTLNRMAQDRRALLNPTYDPGALPWGPATPGEEGKIILPSSGSLIDLSGLKDFGGGMGSVAAFGLIAVVLIGLFRR